ncbi:MAG: shikimate kinase [Planctomycetes bacterium]|nr:shikimate kinase [Planctomycetota bacterium]
MKNKIAFIGARGAGKSKISRKLSKRCDLPVFSTDTLVSYEAGGITIAELVKNSSWPAFRQQEYDILEKLVGMKDVIIDCGGGILVEAPDASQGRDEEAFSQRKFALLSANCHIVYLRQSKEYLINKMSPDANRPDLVGDYEKVLDRRLPWYENSADMVVDLENTKGRQAVNMILDEFSSLFQH